MAWVTYPGRPTSFCFRLINIMTLQERDSQILRLVARFKQCSSKQINTLLFSTSGSATSQKRALDRLLARGYLARIEHRLVGGSKGGSGQYVYQLGRLGWAQFAVTPYTPRRTVDYHALAIVDAFISLIQLERTRSVNIIGVSAEPDCWLTFDGIELRPDLLCELERSGRQRRLWLEVDLGTESQRQVLGKLDAVIKAFGNADGREWPEWPLTIWVAIDEARATELKWLVGRMAEGQRAFFVVTAQAGLAGTILQQLSP